MCGYSRECSLVLLAKYSVSWMQIKWTILFKQIQCSSICMSPSSWRWEIVLKTSQRHGIIMIGKDMKYFKTLQRLKLLRFLILEIVTKYLSYNYPLIADSLTTKYFSSVEILREYMSAEKKKKFNTAILHFVFVIVIEEKSPMFIVIYLHLEDGIEERVMVRIYLKNSCTCARLDPSKYAWWDYASFKM